VTKHQPIPIREIVDALEREANGYVKDYRWLAAQALKQVHQWETRTLMCAADDGPSVASAAK
jgi:hypothetical protein